MDKKKVFVLCVAIAVTASFVTGLFVYFYQKSQIEGSELNYQEIKKYMEISDLEKIIDENYYQDADEGQMVNGTLKGMVEALNDPYSVYYTADEYKEFNKQNDAELVGIGITAGPYQGSGRLKVERVYSASPAETAGIKENDVITAIGGTGIEKLDYESSLNLLRGPSGSSLKIMVQTGAEAPREVEVVRANVNAQRVTYTMLDDKTAWIIISEFNGNCVEEFKKAIEYVKTEGATGMVIDVRGNMDGSIKNAIDMLDEIVPEGVVAYTVDKAENKDEFKVSGEYFDLPLVVLVDANSASAAEVFAGAVQDRGRGQVVGSQTYGKGVVQSVFDMPYYSGGGVKLTSAVYYTPEGKLINGTGITPDIPVEAPADLANLTAETDTQLQQAIIALEGEPAAE